jgi:tryptophan synthase alpha chain
MERFHRMFENGRKTLGVYLTAGFPQPGLDEKMCLAALAAGADFLELGFPFSDPIADGPVIQRASTLSLSKGASLKKTLDLAARLRKLTDKPLVLMGYANPVYHMGYGVFAAALAEAGADGVIVPDLPWEEAEPLRKEMGDRGLSFIPMASPTTTRERLAMLMREGSGFLYLVSMTGITGDVFRGQAPWVEAAEQVRRSGSLPVCVGFGIRTPNDARSAARHADGVIVGTAAIEAVDQGGANALTRLVKGLKAGLSSG